MPRFTDTMCVEILYSVYNVLNKLWSCFGTAWTICSKIPKLSFSHSHVFVCQQWLLYVILVVFFFAGPGKNSILHTSPLRPQQCCCACVYGWRLCHNVISSQRAQIAVSTSGDELHTPCMQAMIVVLETIHWHMAWHGGACMRSAAKWKYSKLVMYIWGGA